MNYNKLILVERSQQEITLRVQLMLNTYNKRGNTEMEE